MPIGEAPFRSLSWSGEGGLRLYARDYGGAESPHAPVICLPGLTRNAADFHELASALAADPARPRRVIAVDCRGRGRSQHDPDPGRYTIATEAVDVLALADALSIRRAVFVGTSRGGLITMTLAATHPDLIAGAVLNDIGPEIAIEGLMRIKAYVGRMPRPRDWAEAAARLKAAGREQFPAFGDEDWLRQARRTFVEGPDGLHAPYDPALALTLESVTPDTPMPPLWPLFNALRPAPLMAVRGTLSDLLTPATFAAMQARRPDMAALEIPDQAHVPPLWEPEVIGRIAGFIRPLD